MNERWTKEQACAWYEKLPWLVGCNFIPSTAINQLEMFQADDFDAETIDRELGWAAELGFNTMRVYLHDLLWEAHSDGFQKTIDRYLAISTRHNIKTLFTLFDDCWNEHAELGKQPEPKPGTHNSGWLQSPGKRVVNDPSQWGRLENYVKGVLTAFGQDDRVIIWDLYNEPGNSGQGVKSLPLLEKTFEWAREANPLQPLTSAVWLYDLLALNSIQLNNSDIITFHRYDSVNALRKDIAELKALGRPVICTEYMARNAGSTFDTYLCQKESNHRTRNRSSCNPRLTFQIDCHARILTMKSIALIAILLLTSSIVRASQYFVDSVAGSDANMGKSPSAAWASLAKVNSTTFLPGDTIYLKRGSRWSGKLSPQGSGVDGRPITIDAYSRGKLPEIDGGGTADYALGLFNVSYWTVRNLEVTNRASSPAVRGGVIVQTINTVSRGIVLQNLFVHDTMGVAAWGNDKWSNGGIRFNIWQDPATLPPTSISDIRVDGCRLQDVHEIGILMLSNSKTMNTGVVVSNNRIDRTGADGIVLEDCDSPVFAGNTCYGAGVLSNDFQYIAAVWAIGCRSPLFEHNEVAYTAVQKTNGQIFYGDSSAFDIDVNCSGTPCIQYNYSHNNGGGFLLVMSTNPVDAIIVRYNLSANDERTNCGDNTTMHIGHGQVYVYNNVFYDGTKVGLHFSNIAGTYFTNNIFCSSGPCEYGTLPSYSHNCYYGHVPNAIDANKLTADPEFVRPGTSADGFSACAIYRLKAGTACRGQGAAVTDAGTSDFFGSKLSPAEANIGMQHL